jgi:hypothetical protein
MDVVAVLEGQYVPPEPPAPAVVVNPELTVDVQQGDCNPQCFTMGFSGSGYHPNSAIDVTFSYVTPDAGSGTDEDTTTSDGAGAWSKGYYEDCNLPDRYTGDVVIDVTATDAEGASASTQVHGTCPAPPAPPATASG